MNAATGPLSRLAPLCATAVSCFALAILAPAGLAQVAPYGSGINPPGSLVVTFGIPIVGGSFSVGVSNTAAASAPASLAFLSLATTPDAAFPSGTVLPGLGLAAPGAPGELLLGLTAPNPFATLGPVPWGGGATAPANFALSVPSIPALTGVTLYLQGALLDVAAGPSLGLTNGLAATLGAPDFFPGLVLIEPGTFQMGSDAPSGAPYFNTAAQQPAHQVTISNPYWMGRYEVSQAEYEAVMGQNPSYFLGPDLPAHRVKWVQAVAYCNALNAQQAALGKVPPGYQYRLPTEAEWEYACRAGTTTEFHYGPELFCDQAQIWFSNHSDSSCGLALGVPPASVGSYAPNAWGLHNMHGNVWEWCLDGLSNYTAAAQTDPYVMGGLSRILRGGGWYFNSDDCRSASRHSTSPNTVFNIAGFRVALAPVLDF